jgi:phosphatidylserine decarboxylase
MLSRDLAVALQLILPHRVLSRIVYYATRWRWRPWKNLLISTITRAYKVDLTQALEPDPEAYASFNAFFTRALKPGARPLATGDGMLVCPADGAISQIGRIRDGRIVQAKGLDYSVGEVLGDDAYAQSYDNGGFATIYLSPRDYHRVHMPYAGRLRTSIHVPGRLFSVAQWTAESIPRLFARNERLVLVFDTDRGPLAVILVGAIFVSSIETVFDGEVTPPYADGIRVREYDAARAPEFAAGAELGRFNMGSTVIVLTGAGFGDWAHTLSATTPVQMGQALTEIEAAPPVSP